VADAPALGVPRLGIDGSIMIVWRALKELDITVKKKSRQADERDRPDVRRRRRRFRRDVKAIDSKRLVFVQPRADYG
jgi:hypothetical protein